jgi:hypothetical protein
VALVYSQGQLEPEQVKESVVECARICNTSGNAIFSIFTDFAGDPCIINLMNITKIKENE